MSALVENIHLIIQNLEKGIALLRRSILSWLLVHILMGLVLLLLLGMGVLLLVLVEVLGPYPLLILLILWGMVRHRVRRVEALAINWGLANELLLLLRRILGLGVLLGAVLSSLGVPAVVWVCCLLVAEVRSVASALSIIGILVLTVRVIVGRVVNLRGWVEASTCPSHIARGSLVVVSWLFGWVSRGVVVYINIIGIVSVKWGGYFRVVWAFIRRLSIEILCDLISPN